MSKVILPASKKLEIAEAVGGDPKNIEAVSKKYGIAKSNVERWFLVLKVYGPGHFKTPKKKAIYSRAVVAGRLKAIEEFMSIIKKYDQRFSALEYSARIDRIL